MVQARQIASIFVDAIAGAAAGWATATTKKDFLTPMMQAREARIGREEQARIREEDRAHAEKMARLQGDINEKQSRLTAQLNRENQEAYARLQDEINDANNLVKFEQDQQTARQAERRLRERTVLESQLQLGIKELEAGRGPAKLKAAINAYQESYVLDNADALPEDAEGEFPLGSALTSNFMTVLESQPREGIGTDLAKTVEETTEALETTEQDENIPAGEKAGMFRSLLDRLFAKAASRPEPMTDDEAALMTRMEQRVSSALLAAQDVEAVENAEVTGDYSQFAPQTFDGAMTGLSDADISRRWSKKFEADYQPAYKQLAGIAAAIADPGNDLTMADVPREVRDALELLVRQDQNGAIQSYADEKLIDQVLRDRENAPKLLGYLRGISGEQLGGALAVTQTQAAKRRLETTQRNVLQQHKIDGDTLESRGFKFAPGDFRVIQAEEEGTARITVLADGAEKGIVSRYLDAAEIDLDTASVVDASQAVKGIRALSNRLGLSEEDTTKMLREVTPRFAEVEAEAFDPSNSFDTITREAASFDDEAVVQLYFKGPEFREAYSEFRASELGFPHSSEVALLWRKELSKTSDPVQRKEIYKKHGLLELYNEDHDAFIMNGGQYFAGQVLDAVMPGGELDNKVLNETYENNVAKLDFEIAEEEAGEADEVRLQSLRKQRDKAEQLIAGTGTSERHRSQAKTMFVNLSRAIAMGPEEVQKYFQANRKSETGVGNVVDEEQLATQLEQIKSAYTGDFEETMGKIINLYIPQVEGVTPTDQLEFSDYVHATWRSAARGLTAAANFDNPKTNFEIPTLVDEGFFWDSSRKVSFRNLAYLLSNSEDLHRFN